MCATFVLTAGSSSVQEFSDFVCTLISDLLNLFSFMQSIISSPQVLHDRSEFQLRWVESSRQYISNDVWSAIVGGGSDIVPALRTLWPFTPLHPPPMSVLAAEMKSRELGVRWTRDRGVVHRSLKRYFLFLDLDKLSNIWNAPLNVKGVAVFAFKVLCWSFINGIVDFVVLGNIVIMQCWS